MNKFILFVVLFGFIAVQVAESAPKGHQRQGHNAVQQEGDIQQVIAAKTQEVLKKTDEVLSGNLPDSKQVIDKVQETGENLVKVISDFNDLIKKKLEENKGTMDSALQDISNNLKNAKEDILKKLGPDGQKKAQEIKDAINKGIKDAAAQVGKISDALKPEAEKIKNDVLTGAKQFLDNAEKFTDELKSQVTDTQKPKH